MIPRAAAASMGRTGTIEGAPMSARTDRPDLYVLPGQGRRGGVPLRVRGGSRTTGLRPGDSFGIRVTVTDDGTRITVEGALDVVTFDVFRAAVLGAAARSTALTVDLADVPVLDRGSLDLLVGLSRRMRRFGRRFELVGVPE